MYYEVFSTVTKLIYEHHIKLRNQNILLISSPYLLYIPDPRTNNMSLLVTRQTCHKYNVPDRPPLENLS